MSESQFDRMLKALKNKDAEIMRLRELLGQCKEEWHDALYADLEHGDRILNNAATEEFNQRYPHVSKFGDLLNFERIDNE